ncbi:hypothetical protein A2U01_0072316, partial [Trifolium medium]|nr:hypothetical protein [Trifolium medium]
MQHRLNPRPPAGYVGRNPLSSSYQQDQFHEEYRPHNVAMDTNLDEPD